MSMSPICAFCEKVFTKQSNLNAHARNVHKVENKNIITHPYDSFNHKCLEGCNVSFRLLNELRQHLESFHDIEIDVEDLTFSTLSEFDAWFEKTCNDENVQYVKANGNSKCKDTVYYTCHRSGKAPPEVSNRKRAQKSQGSCKLNFSCTSQIVLRKKEYGCTAVYHRTHYGHEIDLEHIRISKTDRTSMSAKLQTGVPTKKVLEDIRENTDTDCLKRIDLITRKDLQNIKTYHLKTEDKRHKEDTNTIHFVNIQNADSHSNKSKEFSSESVKNKILDKLANIEYETANFSSVRILNQIERSLDQTLSLIEMCKSKEDYEETPIKKNPEQPKKIVVTQISFYSVKRQGESDQNDNNCLKKPKL